MGRAEVVSREGRGSVKGRIGWCKGSSTKGSSTKGSSTKGSSTKGRVLIVSSAVSRATVTLAVGLTLSPNLN